MRSSNENQLPIYLLKVIMYSKHLRHAFIGESAYYSGPSGLAPSMEFQTSCTNMVSRCVDSRLGPLLARFFVPRHLIMTKWSRMEIEEIIPFSFMNEGKELGRSHQISLALLQQIVKHRLPLKYRASSAIPGQHCRCRSQILSFYWR